MATINGTDFDDTLIGTLTNDTIRGYLGNDYLDGSSGADWVEGGGGNDTVLGGDGLDYIFGGDGDDWMDGGADKDTINGNAGNDTLYGGGGDDNVLGGIGDDLLYGGDGVDFIDGEDGNDIIFSGEGADTIVQGGAGEDIIYGEGGNDRIFGETGNDTLIGGTGADRNDGGSGFDTVDYSSLSTGIAVNLNTNTASGDDATGDTFYSIEQVIGTSFNDTLVGANRASETLHGGAGVDTLTGGFGSTAPDTFHWSAITDSGVAAGSMDIVTDFTISENDRIDFSAIDADTGLGGDQAFSFIGTGAFTAAGQVRYAFDGATTIVQVNVDGDLAADMAIVLSNGNLNLTATSFVL